MNPKMLVQALTDSKAQVLLAFFFAGCAMDTKEIQTWTGLKRETIYKAVDSLVGMDLLAAQTLAHGRKVWLPAADLLPYINHQESVSWTSDPLIIVGPKGEDPVPSNLTIIISKDQESTKRTTAQQLELEAALKEYGIIGRKRAGLIKADWVTADYVRAHCENAKSEGWEQPIGMAIYMMENQTPQPAPQVDRWSNQGRKKYTLPEGYEPDEEEDTE